MIERCLQRRGCAGICSEIILLYSPGKIKNWEFVQAELEDAFVFHMHSCFSAPSATINIIILTNEGRR